MTLHEKVVGVLFVWVSLMLLAFLVWLTLQSWGDGRVFAACVSGACALLVAKRL